MKKILLSALAFCGLNASFAQTVVIPTGNPPSSNPSTSVARKPYGTYWGFERSAMIYTSSEIGISGIINQISFFLDAASSPSSAPVKIYLKEVSFDQFSATTSVANEESGATLVYDGTISSGTFVPSSFINVTLDNPFNYSGTGNLEIIVETNAGGTGNEGSSAKTFRFNNTGTLNSFQYWQADNTPPGGLGTIGNHRPNVKFEFTPSTPCVDPPNPGVVTANDTTSCIGSALLLSLSGNSVGTGQTYQWQISLDNNTWTDISNATLMIYSQTFSEPAYFRCAITCGSTTVYTPSIFINQKNFLDCYCSSSATSSADDDIGNVTFNTINNGVATPSLNNPSSTNTYTDFTSISTNLVKGNSYPISVSQINSSSFYACDITVYIDFNRNAVFENSEKFFLGRTSTSTMTLTGTISVPTNASSGVTRMRVVLTETTNITSCGTYTFGETEDYTVVIEEAQPCTDPPVAGTTLASKLVVCPSEVVNFSLQGFVYGSGQTLTWQISNDSIQWNDIANANNNTYSSSFNATTYLRCKVTCTTVEYSVPVKITVNPFYNCYCTPSHGSCYNEIVNITIQGTPFNNNTTCSGGNGYTQVGPGPGTTATLIKGLPYNFEITTSSSQIVSVWIDYNQNGSFEASEWFQPTTASVANTATVYSFTVPTSALSGPTGMRIRTRDAGNTNDANSSCSNFYSGETLDYTVILDDPGPCTDPPVAGTTVASKTQVCPSEPVNFSLQGNTYGSGQTYTWQSSSDGTIWNDIINAYQSVYSVSSLSSDAYFRCKLTCGNGIAFSSPVQVTVKPFNLCYCNSGLQTNNCDNNIGILGVEVLWEDFINYNQCISSGPAYTSFSNNDVTDNFGVGQTYTIRVIANSTVNIGMWIDFNQNGVFESSEFTLIATNQPAGSPADKNFTIPTNAALGATGMRVRIRSTNFGASDACTTFSSGETQDYTVTIDNSTGLKANRRNTTLSLSPNPAKTEVTLNANYLIGKDADIAVYNINGALVYQTKTALVNGQLKANLNTANMANGIYQVQVITEGITFNEKLIIQH